jgi:Skp family chaperone for outer membrane proteins
MNKQYFSGLLCGVTLSSFGLAALLVSSGFQGASQKTGIVDLNKAIEGLAISQKVDEKQKNFANERQAMGDFLVQNRVMKREDMERFWILSSKTNRTEAEKAELEKIKANAIEGKKKFDDIQLKPAPTDAELKMLDEYRNRQAASQDFLGRLQSQAEFEISSYRNSLLQGLEKQVLDAVSEVGKKQGYSTIFVKQVAPFSANDITDEVNKVLAKSQ